MKIQVSNITYNLYDFETNPNNDLTARDFDLPSELMIDEQIENIEQELIDIINSHTGFEVDTFQYRVID